MTNVRSIHFVGIKGVGMAPLALIAKEAGCRVTGSDIADVFITDSMLQDAGIVPFIGFDKKHVGNVDLVVTTGAHRGFDNQEVIAAKEKGIPVLTQGEAVGEYMKGLFRETIPVGISVAGTHGKTTTTAMVATIFKKVHLDPSWVVGTASIPSLGWGGHFGLGNYVIAEADEYANEPIYDKTPKLLLQHPRIAVITNIEHDHPDVYARVEDMQKTFLEFVKEIPKDGTLVAYGDDIHVQNILKDYKGQVITYGFGKNNQYVLFKETQHTYTVFYDNKSYSTFHLSVVGDHNGLNALASLLVAKTCGVEVSVAADALHDFIGTKRRMEYIGQLPTGALLYDDYAHHPTEIEKTLFAFKEKYLDKKIICVFQPHTYSRTKLLFSKFIDSLAIADAIILTDIYASQREKIDPAISSSMLVEGLTKKGKKAHLAPSLADVVKYLHSLSPDGTMIVITMGAGDIYQIANQLMEHASAPSDS